MAFLKEERKDKIIRYLSKNNKASIQELCSVLEASEATIRRYLRELSERKLVKRISGGVTLPSTAKLEPPIIQRTRNNMDEKSIIGKASAELIKDGETIFLGSGSTVLEVAKNIKNRSNITIISNSLPVINLLSDNYDIDVIITGGFLRKEELSLIGHLVSEGLRELRADKVIIGIQGIHLQHGLTNNHLPEAITDRTIIKFAPEVIIVADHTKFGQINSTFVGELSKEMTIVTDQGIPHDYKDRLPRIGIRLIVANKTNDREG